MTTTFPRKTIKWNYKDDLEKIRNREHSPEDDEFKVYMVKHIKRKMNEDESLMISM